MELGDARLVIIVIIQIVKLYQFSTLGFFHFGALVSALGPKPSQVRIKIISFSNLIVLFETAAAAVSEERKSYSLFLHFLPSLSPPSLSLSNNLSLILSHTHINANPGFPVSY